MEAMATNTTICCHCVKYARKSGDGRAHEHRDACHLRGGGEKCRHRRGRALVDVGRPHMERNRRDLEAEAGEQENDAENQSELGSRAALAMPANDTVPVKP